MTKHFLTAILKSKIYYKPKNNNRYLTKKYLPFSSEIEMLKKENNFVMFEKNKWIKFRELEIINKKDYNFSKIFKYFLKIKYKWGGKTFDGIDCSALLQIFYKYNHKWFPRDTKDQIRVKKGVKNKKVFKNFCF